MKEILFGFLFGCVIAPFIILLSFNKYERIEIREHRAEQVRIADSLSLVLEDIEDIKRYKSYIRVIEIDSCEYLINMYRGSIKDLCHKGDCKNPIHKK